MDEKKDLNSKSQVIPDDQIDPRAGFAWDRESISLYFDKVLPSLTSRDVNAQEFFDLLLSCCVVEKSWHEGFSAFFTKVKEMGLQVEGEQKTMQDFASKIFYWRFVRAMIFTNGLAPFEDDIMKYEIAKFYGFDAPPVRAKPLNHGSANVTKPKREIRPIPKGPLSRKPKAPIRVNLNNPRPGTPKPQRGTVAREGLATSTKSPNSGGSVDAGAPAVGTGPAKNLPDQSK